MPSTSDREFLKRMAMRARAAREIIPPPMIERAVRLTWLRCPCGKIHALGGSDPASVCTCGRRVWDNLHLAH